MSRPPLAAERFRLLLEHFRSEWLEAGNPEHGWKKAAATKIGVSRPMISQVYDGEKNAGGSTVAKAKRAFDLPGDFFMDSAFDASGYLAQLAGGSAPRSNPREVEDEALAEFMERFGDQYHEWTIEGLHSRLIAGRDGGPMSVGDYIDLADRLERVVRGEAEIVVRPKGGR